MIQKGWCKKVPKVNKYKKVEKVGTKGTKRIKRVKKRRKILEIQIDTTGSDTVCSKGSKC